MNISNESFSQYRCDQAMQLGLNMGNLHKIFGAFSNGSCSIVAESDDAEEKDEEDMEDEETGKKKKKTFSRAPLAKKQTYELRMMDLDVEQLGIPEQDYQATFSMPSAEFTKIVKDLLIIGESVTIDVKKSGVTFRAEGEIGKSEVHLEKGEAIGDDDSAFELEVQ